LGVGSANLINAKVRDLNKAGEAATEKVAPSGKVRSLGAHISEAEACSACYASLVFALSRLDPNEMARLKEKVCVGQGFLGKEGKLGVGQCCAGFSTYCPGCPPSGADILAFLHKG
jgi:hypothetical protein